MSERYDVIVVGVGAMGSATCEQLARRGLRVLGLDRASIPNDLSSHTGHSRMIRLAYYEHPSYVPLLRRAYALWRELEARSGRKLLHITGGLYTGRSDDDFVSGSIRSAEEHALPHEVLTRRQVAERYPQFHVPDDYIGFYEPEAGLLVPERVVQALAELALRQGATLRGHEPVTRWTSDTHGVTVETERATYQAEKLVLCSGAWSPKLLGEGATPVVPLQVTRQVLGWVWPRRPELFTPDRFPSFAVSHADGSAHYGFPMIADVPGAGFKIAHHWHGPAADPDTIDRVGRREDERDFVPALERFLPDAAGPVLAMKVCMYTNTPDSHFVIDRHPRHERVTIACGFSGHGFKFASVVGDAVADLVEKGETELPIGFLGAGRFSLQRTR